ncbi:MAG: NTP transferase domain-containing protein, partial [Crenarchaeota archaeon]|nr:NTP transferase domain-containing protein [Thermoproteota archaeon]
MTVFILAGGEGRRFGGDKLVALVDGEPGISRVVEAAWRAGAGEVLISTRSVERCRLYLSLAEASGC